MSNAAIELLGVLLIVLGILYASLNSLLGWRKQLDRKAIDSQETFQNYLLVCVQRRFEHKESFEQSLLII